MFFISSRGYCRDPGRRYLASRPYARLIWEAAARASAKRRVTWLRQYIDAIIQRDVRSVASIDKLDQLPIFLRALAQMAGQMCNYTQLGGQVGLDGKTAARYVGVFEQMYLLKRNDVWVTCLVFSSQFHLETLAPLVDLFFHSDMNSAGVL